MRVICAPNALKGCLSAVDAAAALSRGARRAGTDIEALEMPIADGGDGTLEVLAKVLGGELIEKTVLGPANREVSSSYLILPDGRAVVELARASGIKLLQREDLRPLTAHTFGVGQLILDAIERGATEVILALGGSASTDCGTGLLKALGVKFLDAQGSELELGGAALKSLLLVDITAVSEKVLSTKFTVLCDVENPLCGEKGTVAIFAPQKGAQTQDLLELTLAIENFSKVISQQFSKDLANTPRCGVAGGTSSGMYAILNANLVSGFDYVAQVLGVEDKIRNCDLVLTSEGRLDSQTLDGKGPHGVALIAKRSNVPVVGLFGQYDFFARESFQDFSAIQSIANGPNSLEQMLESATERLEFGAENSVRFAQALRRSSKTS